jgi:hypothetical protein
MPNQEKTLTKRRKRLTWTNQTLEETMEVLEIGIHSQQKASKSLGIPLTSMFDHLNGKTRSRKWDQQVC